MLFESSNCNFMSQFRVIRPAVVRLVGPAFIFMCLLGLLNLIPLKYLFLSILFLCYYDMSSFAYLDLLLYMSFYTLVEALIYLVLKKKVTDKKLDTTFVFTYDINTIYGFFCPTAKSASLILH